MAQQTAGEWLISQLYISEDSIWFKEIREQAKEMEKQQIIDAVIYGNRQEFYDGTETIGEQYYNETYKQK
jgi:hypothetical protein